MPIARRPTQTERAKERREAEESLASRKKKLTPKEQEDLEEKQLEEACEKWFSRIIRVVMLGSMVWGMLSSASEWALRPPVLIEPVGLAGRTFVLTGGTDGMGAAAARQLARSGARVVIGARNVSKAEALGAALRAEAASGRVEARYLDLGQLSSVVAFAASLTLEAEAAEAGVDGLLNNAGGLPEAACDATADGFEATTQLNYLGPALLTKLLLPALERAGQARILTSTVASPTAPQRACATRLSLEADAHAYVYPQ